MTPLLIALQIAGAPAADNRPIVITATPLTVTERALAECVARRCPADEDSNVATAHAENQFVAGDYGGARRTLQAALKRQSGEARRFPVAVADLWRSNGRVASHMGMGDSYRISSIEAAAALRAGLGEDDPRYIAQRMELGDAAARMNEIDRARDLYRWGIRRAAAIGNDRLRGFGLFRLGMLEAAMGPTYRAAARRSVAELLAISDPGTLVYRDAGRLLDARLKMEADGGAAFEGLLAELRTGRSERPVLLTIPEAKTTGTGAASLAPIVQTSISDGPAVPRDQWVDIGFWIKPDGSVADVEMMRASKVVEKSADLRRTWVAPLIAAAGERRYMPLTGPRDAPGLFRLERYTQVLLKVKDYRARSKQRGDIQTIMMDLTNDPAPGPVK